jgi:hypothetical protein
MRIEYNTIQETMNKLERIMYFNGLPNNDFIKHMVIRYLYDSVIVNLLKTTDFSDYINSFRENSEHV